MGKRGRKRRGTAPRPAPSAPAPPSAPAERARAPWHPVPLVELSVLAGIVLIVVGFLALPERRGAICLVAGTLLASLGGLDTAVREHFAGRRSHTTALAGLPALVAAVGLFAVHAPLLVLGLAPAVLFIGAFTAFRRAFRRHSGGLSFR